MTSITAQNVAKIGFVIKVEYTINDDYNMIFTLCATLIEKRLRDFQSIVPSVTLVDFRIILSSTKYLCHASVKARQQS